MKICSIDGCDLDYVARGYCKAHYSRWRKGQDMSVPVRPRARLLKKCKISGCESKSKTLAGEGYCGMHRRRSSLGQSMEAEKRQASTYAGAHKRIVAFWGRATQYPCVRVTNRPSNGPTMAPTPASYMMQAGPVGVLFSFRYILNSTCRNVLGVTAFRIVPVPGRSYATTVVGGIDMGSPRRKLGIFLISSIRKSDQWILSPTCTTGVIK